MSRPKNIHQKPRHTLVLGLALLLGAEATLQAQTTASAPPEGGVVLYQTQSSPPSVEEIPVRKRSLTLLLPQLESVKIRITSRDPFISPFVKDPFVTQKPEEEEELAPKAHNLLVKLVEQRLKAALENSLAAYGVSSDEPNTGNYVFIEGVIPEKEERDIGPSLRKEGEEIRIQLSEEGMANLQEAAKIAAQDGFELDVGFPISSAGPTQPGPDGAPAGPPSAPSVEIVINKIDRRTVSLTHVATGIEFELRFKRDFRLRGAPTAGPGGPENAAGNKKPVPPPPKI
jgi:hypothetical protein